MSLQPMGNGGGEVTQVIFQYVAVSLLRHANEGQALVEAAGSRNRSEVAVAADWNRRNRFPREGNGGEGERKSTLMLLLRALPSWRRLQLNMRGMPPSLHPLMMPRTCNKEHQPMRGQHKENQPMGR